MKQIIISFALIASFFTAATTVAFQTTGFSDPYGVAVDAKTNFIYVSNMNGAPTSQDDNGFISRLKGDGTVDELRFIDAASKGVTLNAPKGMAVTQDKLYVADIDKLRAFELSSGKFLFDVNFGDLPIQHFYDVTVGPDGALYLTDGPGNTIYRIDTARQHEVTTFISGEDLGQPHGIVWFPGRQVFAIAGWSSGKVIAFDKAGKRQTYPAILLRTLEGIVADDAGNMFVASTGLNAVYRIAANFELHTFKLALKSPGGMAYQKSDEQIIAACLETDAVESLPLFPKEAAAKSPVADYVQPPPAPKVEEKPSEKAPQKEELKEETKEEVKEEAKEELKEETKEEVKEEAKEEAKEEMPEMEEEEEGVEPGATDVDESE